MKVSLFCVTHAGDSDWLKYLLKSIAMNCSGFHETVLAIERGREGPITSFGLTLEKIRFYENPKHIDPYMLHMHAKCSADQLCTGDYICYVDSDCVFRSATTPDTYFHDGKPIVLYQSYASLGNAVPWQVPTERALGFPVSIETMRAHGATYKREHLEEFRTHIQKVHGKSLHDYLSKWSRHTHSPDTFSEFCAIGAWLDKFHHDEYHWVNTETDPLPPNPIRQFWSFHRANHPDVQAEMRTYGL